MANAILTEQPHHVGEDGKRGVGENAIGKVLVECRSDQKRDHGCEGPPDHAGEHAVAAVKEKLPPTQPRYVHFCTVMWN